MEEWKSSYGAILRVARVRTSLHSSHLLKVLRFLRRAIRKHYKVVHDEHRIAIYLLEAHFADALLMNVWACVWYGVRNTTIDNLVQDLRLESSWIMHEYFISIGCRSIFLLLQSC